MLLKQSLNIALVHGLSLLEPPIATTNSKLNRTLEIAYDDYNSKFEEFLKELRNHDGKLFLCPPQI